MFSAALRSLRDIFETTNSHEIRCSVARHQQFYCILKRVFHIMILEPLSFGVGDRFAHQAVAQLRAFELLFAEGVEVVPVWNKSHREHTTIGSEPRSLREAADIAVKQLDWEKPYYIDADHIRLETVDEFVASANFFTLDVADFIGGDVDDKTVEHFLDHHPELIGNIEVAGISAPIETTRAQIQAWAAKYLPAVAGASAIYSRIADAKGAENFVTEVSMDETDAPQTPPELLVILAALGAAQIPLQTIAPKFSGRFNKGVDYVGDIAQFEREFGDDLCVISHAIPLYSLPSNLKLSVHSGSDKFSIYAPIRRQLGLHRAGLHIKTAGTTWLEEVIGLAISGQDGLGIARDIYRQALAKQAELCAPYAAVIDIDAAQLPAAETVDSWSGEEFAAALRHDQSNEKYNPSLRQLIHVGYKIAAQMGTRYTDALERNAEIVGNCVTENLFERHLKPLFLGE